MKYKLSEQSKVLVKNMPGLDLEDLEKWFEENLTIGSNNIQMYLLEKEKEKKQEKKDGP